MPNFAPNKGFKMPGVGSKNIDSPGNFRDEQHVDKVGYCDTTEDSMLPEGSSPLKARYTQSGYLKDLDAISIPQGKKITATKAPKKQEKVVVKKEETKPTKTKVDFRANRKFNTDFSTTIDPNGVSKAKVPPPTKPVVKAKKYIKYSDLPGGSEGAAATAARAENKASGRGDFASTTGKGGRKDDKSRYTVRENETEAQAKKRKMDESR